MKNFLKLKFYGLNQIKILFLAPLMISTEQKLLILISRQAPIFYKYIRETL